MKSHDELMGYYNALKWIMSIRLPINGDLTYVKVRIRFLEEILEMDKKEKEK